MSGHLAWIRSPRFVVNGVLICAVIASGVFGYRTVFASTPVTSSGRDVTVSDGTVSYTVTASGSVAAKTTKDVSFKTNGTIKKVLVHSGEQVKKGQPLATLDRQTAELLVQSNEAALMQAQEALSQAEDGNETSVEREQDDATVEQLESTVASDRSTLATAETDLGKARSSCSTSTGSTSTGSTSAGGNSTTGSNASIVGTACADKAADVSARTSDESSLTNAEQAVTDEDLSLQAKRSVTPATLLTDKVAVSQARETLSASRKSLARTTLYAPISGEVTAVDGKAGASAGTATFAVISNLKHLVVTADFAEADASKVKLGQSAQVTLAALSSTVNGKVAKLASTATTTSNVVTYADTISLTDPSSKIKQGMTADVSVTTSSRSNVLEVPTAAITTTGGTSTVKLVRDGTQSTVTVTTGLAGDSTTQIKSGLTAGETIIEPTATVSSGTSTSTTSGFGGSSGFGGTSGGPSFGGGTTTGGDGGPPSGGGAP